MLLITPATDDIELIACESGTCEFYAMRDDADALGWWFDEPNGIWRCEGCADEYRAYWGMTHPLARVA
ncbi:hypothetical protein ACN20G_28045 (plasmid) [Streptomyces sp. BI20]|uniref:hypothetical protein n=1 Tax=Streptomyces sp. BI20 TaxID=3403460 RepID=UPI003C72EAE6